MKPQAIVLLSGGLDSAVSLWLAKKKGWACSALTFDYGQRHKKELRHAQRLARIAKVPFKVVRFSLPWGGSSLVDKKTRLPRRSLSKISHTTIPSTYVPARNTLFLSFALSWADQKKAQYLVIGANAIDYSGYPDCRPVYIKSFERMANKATRLGTEQKKNIKIVAPLLKLSKADIVRLGLKLGVPINKTWSCYAGGKTPCGTCDSCRLRQKGIREACLPTSCAQL